MCEPVDQVTAALNADGETYLATLIIQRGGSAVAQLELDSYR